jgi:chaperone LolA
MRKRFSMHNIKYNSKSSCKNFLILFSTCFLILYPGICSSSQNAEDEVKKIQEAYSKIEDIKGSFTQKSSIKDLKRTDTYKGFLYIKRPSKIKWEYTGDKAQEITINNNKITIYNKKDKQAIRSNFDKQTYGQAPIALLSGFGNIKEEFQTTSKNNKLILIPKNTMGNIASIEIGTSPENFPIKSFTIIDTRSNKIEITLEDVEINTGIKESLFETNLPEGTKIYEHNP